MDMKDALKHPRYRPDLYDSERDYFMQNTGTAGMAADDGKVILNPYSPNTLDEQGAVVDNEMARLLMREQNIEPPFDLTREQGAYFEKTPYADDILAARRSLAARVMTGDPSAGEATSNQAAFAEKLRQLLAGFK
jgi:hypothetical protein